MHWVLIITWISFIGGAGSSGVGVTTWPTLKECFAIGKMAQDNFHRLYSAGNTLNFTCYPSDGSTQPVCGLTGQEPCK